jgi:hypothetical protein
MENRFKSILGLLSGEDCQREMQLMFSPYFVEGFKEVDRNEYAHKFKLEMEPSTFMFLDEDFKDRNAPTFLQFYLPASGDNILTIVIEHYFGQLGLRGTDDFNSVEVLCHLLAKNMGTFLGTGAYLGITMPQNNTVYASLNSMLHFLAEWSDGQIARVLSFQLAGMFKGLENNWDESFTILKRFGDTA